MQKSGKDPRAGVPGDVASSDSCGAALTVLLTRPRRGADVAADEDADWASTWRPLICRYRFVDGSNPTRSLRIGRLWVVDQK